MTAGTGVLRIDETFLGPRALPPPPTRHALFAIIVAMAALIHVGSIGLGDLYSETEGQYAAAAREMLQSRHLLMPTNESIPRLQKPPLLYWLIIASYKIFGVNSAAARLPIALSVVATTALTFVIAERLRDYWQGFVARSSTSHAAPRSCWRELSCPSRCSARSSPARFTADLQVFNNANNGRFGLPDFGFAPASPA